MRSSTRLLTSASEHWTCEGEEEEEEEEEAWGGGIEDLQMERSEDHSCAYKNYVIRGIRCELHQ